MSSFSREEEEVFEFSLCVAVFARAKEEEATPGSVVVVVVVVVVVLFRPRERERIVKRESLFVHFESFFCAWRKARERERERERESESGVRYTIGTHRSRSREDDVSTNRQSHPPRQRRFQIRRVPRRQREKAERVLGLRKLASLLGRAG